MMIIKKGYNNNHLEDGSNNNNSSYGFFCLGEATSLGEGKL